MPRPNLGPRLKKLQKPGWQRPVWYIRWTEKGLSRERSTGTESYAEARRALTVFRRQFGFADADDLVEETRTLEADISADLDVGPAARRQVATPVGRIDILTDDEVIEVKLGRLWREAIGQVLAYRIYYPDRQPRVHLFGEIQPVHLQACHTVCEAAGIRLTRQKEFKL